MLDLVSLPTLGHFLRPDDQVLGLKLKYIYILIICFCSFDLFCPLLEKDNLIENLCIALSCPIK